MHNFKVGDIVKMDLKKITKWSSIPEWYSTETFTIKKFHKSKLTGNIVAHLDKKLPNRNASTIWVEFLSLDILTIRKMKLKKLTQLTKY